MQGTEGDWFCKVCGNGLTAIDEFSSVGIKCPYAVGDRVWARETWGLSPNEHGHTCLWYRADGEDYDEPQMMRLWNHETKSWILEQTTCPSPTPDNWRPSIHMPKWAARIWRDIVGIRYERLQDISEEDARAEGMTGRLYQEATGKLLTCGRDIFQWYWDTLHPKKDRWADNPWVSVLTLKGEG
ncbi:unnamed protein product [marine sediment metagenome]|uniref:Uncharacterized protein n=1 Tax=marine sediment metagenome TaxID=412755 RepID=X1UE98_9ZZZZ